MSSAKLTHRLAVLPDSLLAFHSDLAKLGKEPDTLLFGPLRSLTARRLSASLLDMVRLQVDAWDDYGKVVVFQIVARNLLIYIHPSLEQAYII